jgi:hypothetical protein
MDSLLIRVNKATFSDKPLQDLESLVYALSTEGLTKQNIYNLIGQYRKSHLNSAEWLALAEKFNGDHPIDLTLDRLCGWCRHDLILLPKESLEIH